MVLLIRAIAAGLLALPLISHAHAAPATGPACQTGHVFWVNVLQSRVMTWDPKAGELISQTSGHLELCGVYGQNIGGEQYYEYKDLSLPGDCVSEPSGVNPGVIGLNGCQAGKKTLLWVVVYQPPPSTVESILPLAAGGLLCVENDRLGDPMLVEPCDNGSNTQRWKVLPG